MDGNSEQLQVITLTQLPISEERLRRTGGYCATQQCETVCMAHDVQAMRLEYSLLSPKRFNQLISRSGWRLPSGRRSSGV